MKPMHGLLGALIAVASMGTAIAQQNLPPSPYERGWYLAPMATWVTTDDDRLLDDGLGGTLAFGNRLHQNIALELALHGVTVDRDVPAAAAPAQANTGEESDMIGGHLAALLFPFNSGLFFSAAIGYLESEPEGTSGRAFEGAIAEAGIGYLIPLSFGNYEFGIRAEARARRAHNENFDATVDDDGRDLMTDYVYNLGLQLPFGVKPPPPPPPPPPKVVAPVKICADGQDNDGDGLVDFPEDKGCSSRDDDDETDPPQCSDGRDNDGDGLVDFPNDPGCSAADDNDEEDPCKTPVPGERISLKGCGTGDIVVLRGVNFDFDKATLTPNARLILDNVSGELQKYPDITVELSGHTDSRGSDKYNKNLSDRRAASVKKYLVDKGVDAARMTTIGLGESQPVADNATDEGRDLNRRTELKVLTGVAGAPGTEAYSSGNADVDAYQAEADALPDAPAADQ